MDIPSTTVPLSKFIQEQEHFMQEKLELLSRMLISDADRILKDPPFCFKEKTARQVAEGVVLKGEVLMTNADPEDDDEDEAEWINDIGDEYALALKVAFLPIQAPVEEADRSLACDTESRDKQIKNFMQLHPELQRKSLKIHKSDTEVVHKYEAMKNAIESFISEYGTRAIVASVAFLGHGTEQGIRFHEDEEVKLDAIITDMQAMLKEKRSKRGLPSMIELIFSQCYGHLYEEPESTDFIIYHFTSEDCTKTYVRESRDGLTQDVTDAHHMQLEGHVEQSQRGWNDAQTEKTRAVQDDAGPATAVGGVSAEAGDFDEVECLE